MSKVVFVCVALVLAFVSAQIRPTCNMPQLWEGRRIAFDPNQRAYHNHTSQFRSFARYSYDGINQRKRIFEEVQFGTTPNQRLDILELYVQRLAYVTNLGTQKCLIYTIPANRPFYRHDINANATFEGYETLGAYPDYLTLSQWVSPNVTNWRGTGNRFQTFTQNGCVPVRDDFFSNQTGFTFEEFSDVTLGLHDPNIFNPPSGCTPAPPPPPAHF